MYSRTPKYILLLLFLFSLHTSAQKKTYDGQGAVSEIIMASPAEMVGHFDMFFNAKPGYDELDKQMYWYKIVFNKDCSFDFTLFPLVETDRYSFIAFKTQNDLNFCEARVNQKVTTINDIRLTRVYNDNEQTAAFRSNLIYTKKVPVKAGEAVYIVVKNLWGKDLGHIIGLNTCDYSYVLEAEKVLSKSDTTIRQDKVYSELQEEEAMAVVGRKLCPLDNIPVKLGTINFNKKIGVSNQLYQSGSAKGSPPKKIIPTDITPTPKDPVVVAKINPAPDPTKPKTSAPSSAAPQAPISTTTSSPISNATTTQKNTPQPKELAKLTSTNDPKKLKPEINKFIPVKCLITDIVKGLGIDNTPTITDELTGKPLEVKKLKNGEYEFVIEKGKNYKVDCNAIGYKNFDHSINIYKALKGEGNEMEIKLQPLVAGENFILKNIYFHANTPVIKNESNKELEKLSAFMKNNPDAVISIEGHTNSNRHISRDNRREQIGGKWAFHGTAKKLSKFRADEVMGYLKKKGIDSDRIKTKGWGGDHELYPNARTLDESSQNMRVEVVILKI